MKLICQHAFWPDLVSMVISRPKNWSKKCLKCQFWAINPNYPIWCLNIISRHLQWLPMVTYDWNWWCKHAFWSVYGFIVISCVTIGQKYAKKFPWIPNIQYCSRRFFITTYCHIWLEFILSKICQDIPIGYYWQWEQVCQCVL